jgi:hypothetical protein
VTLATPFLQVFRSEPSGSEARGFKLLHFLLLFVIILAPVAYIIAIVGGRVLDSTVTLIIMIAIFCYAIFVLGSLPPLAYRVAFSLSKRITLIESMSSRPYNFEAKVSLLVVRAIDDEASLSIAAGSIGTRLAALTVSAVGGLFLALSRLKRRFDML